MDFRRLQWLFPIAVVLHNAEEAIWMPGWEADHAAQLPIAVPGAAKVRLALFVLTVAVLVVTALSARKGPGTIWAYLTFGYIVAILANVFVPHVPAAMLFRGYVPGLITAVAINLPLMSYLVVRAIRDGWVRGRKAVASAVAVPAALAGLIAMLFTSGKIISYVF